MQKNVVYLSVAVCLVLVYWLSGYAEELVRPDPDFDPWQHVKWWEPPDDEAKKGFTDFLKSKVGKTARPVWKEIVDYSCPYPKDEYDSVFMVYDDKTKKRVRIYVYFFIESPLGYRQSASFYVTRAGRVTAYHEEGDPDPAPAFMAGHRSKYPKKNCR